jgi:competence protein ComEC
MGGSSANSLAAIAFISLLVIIAALSGCTEKVQQPEPSKVNISGLNNASAADLGSKELLLVYFLDVGQGDSILIQFAGKNVLIDGGEEDMGLKVVSYLKDHGVSSLDLVVATHPHSDHIGGLITVLNAIPVKQILDSGQAYSTRTYEDFLNIIDQKNIPIKAAKRGQVINIDPG